MLSLKLVAPEEKKVCLFLAIERMPGLESLLGTLNESFPLWIFPTHSMEIPLRSQSLIERLNISSSDNSAQDSPYSIEILPFPRTSPGVRLNL